VPEKAAVLMHDQVDEEFPWLHQQSLGCAASYLSFWKMKAQEKAILVVLQGKKICGLKLKFKCLNET